jgi:uncharacterized membrane protein
MIRVIRGDVAAPAYFLVLHAWEIPFGDTDVAMRALSALLATLTLVPFYLLARRVLESRAAIVVACGLMADSLMQVQYAKEARYYALMGFLGMTALACVPVMATRKSWGARIIFIACVAVGMYTHGTMAFVVVGLVAGWMVWPGERTIRQRALDVVMTGAIVVVIYLPWVPTLLRQMRWMTGTFWATRPDAFAIGQTTSAIAGVDVYTIPSVAWETLGVSGMSAGGVAGLVSLVLVVLVALALATRDTAKRRAALGLIAFAFVPVVLVFVRSLTSQPIFLDRLFIASSAVMPILFAMAIECARGRTSRVIAWVLVASVGMLTIVSTSSLLRSERKEDWRGAYQTVAALPESDRRLLVFVANEGELPFAYYAAHDPLRKSEPRTGAPGGYFDWDPPQTIRRVLSESDLEQLRGEMKSGKWDEIVLILAHTDFADPDGRTERLLREKWTLASDTPLRLVRIVRFVNSSPL